jgi:hypothetical protein
MEKLRIVTKAYPAVNSNGHTDYHRQSHSALDESA